MNRDPGDLSVSPILSALVVEPREIDRTLIVLALTSAGFRVTGTEDFSEARVLIVTQTPFVLVTAVRLGAFNGLQLVLRGRSMRPNMAALVISDAPDSVLQREAEKVGATFVVKPLKAPELLAALYRTALRPPRPDGTIEPVRPPFERRRRDRRQVRVGVLERDRREGERRDAALQLLIAAAARN